MEPRRPAFQIAEEGARLGRQVTLSVGGAVRCLSVLTDIMWWLNRPECSTSDRDEVDDLVRARNIPSPQLVGTPERRTLDINALTDQGVELGGRIARIVDGTAQFSVSLRNLSNLADLKMNRLLDTIDVWVSGDGLDGDVDPSHRFAPTRSRIAAPQAWTSPMEGSRRSSGRPVSDLTIPGSTRGSWTVGTEA